MTFDKAKHRPDLVALAEEPRRQVIKKVTDSDAEHIRGPVSLMDLLATLYFKQRHIRPEQPDWPDRDHFPSKGYAAIGHYAVLALKGLSVDELPTFGEAGSRLQGHPDAMRLPGFDSSTGSLGQGLSFGVGVALGAQMADFHTFATRGDGEIQEGMVWEEVQTASRYRLTSLTAIVDRNGLQQFNVSSEKRSGPTDRGDRRGPCSGIDVGSVFTAFGWQVLEVDDHDFHQLRDAYTLARALVMTTEEHPILGGRGGLVAEVLTSAGPPPSAEGIDIDDTWSESANNEYPLEKYGLSAKRISDRTLLRLSSSITAGVR